MCAGKFLIKISDIEWRTPSARSIFRSIKAFTSALIQRLLNPKPSPDLVTESAVRWLLAASADPENIAAAAGMIPAITWAPDSDIASHCQWLRDTFVGCFDAEGHLGPSEEERALACGRALNHLRLAGIQIGDQCSAGTASQRMRMWHQWRSVVLPRGFNQCKTLVCQLPTLSEHDRQRCQADIRTTLRMMVAAAADGFIHPDSDSIIWRGQFMWDGDRRMVADFDWLIDYLMSSYPKDDTVVGDALLVLSAMGGLGSPDRSSTYLRVLVSAMQSSSPRRVRYAALRAVSQSRTAFADLNVIEDQTIRDLLPTKLSPALLTAICPDPCAAENEPDIAFNYWRDDAYLQLIIALASNKQWRKHLVDDQHIEHCVLMLNNLDNSSLTPFRLAAIFGQLCPDAAAFEGVADTDLISLVKSAWQSVLELKLYDEDGCMSVLPAVIHFTEQRVIPEAVFKDVRKNVYLTAKKLKGRNKHPDLTSLVENCYTRLTV